MTDQAKVVTEDDLLKSIKELEAKAAPNEKAPDPQPEIVKVTLAKSTAEAIRDGANAGTKKALDVSDVLTDLVGLLGKHNDEALQTLQKSINAGAERDLAITKVLVDLKKAIDELGTKVEKYGNEPRAPLSAKKEEVLHKSGNGGAVKLDPLTSKRAITHGLEILAKSLDPTDPKTAQKFSEITHAAIRFESTGQIEDRYIAAAQKALAAPAA